MTNERGTEKNRVVEHGKGGTGVDSFMSKFLDFFFLQHYDIAATISTRSAFHLLLLSPPARCYALQWHIVPMSPHAAKRVTRVRIQSRDRDRETDKCRRRIASLVLGREGQKPPSRTQREVISAARTVVDVVQGEVLYDFYAKSRKINGFSLP